MAKKKSIVRKPIEKLSEKEAVVLIEDSSSEEEEEIELPVIPPPPKLTKQSTNKVPCDICGKEFSKGGIRMHRQSCEKKNSVVADVEVPKTIKKEKVKKEKKSTPIAEGDKPMTMNQMKEFMATQQKPAEPKQKRTYKKREPKPKQPAPTPPPTPVVVNKSPQMLFV